MVDVVGTPGNVIKSSLVTAFTLTAAFVWKDVLEEIAVKAFPGSELSTKALAAFFVTVLVALAIWIVLKTEDEAEYVISKLVKSTGEEVKVQDKASSKELVIEG